MKSKIVQWFDSQRAILSILCLAVSLLTLVACPEDSTRTRRKNKRAGAKEWTEEGALLAAQSAAQSAALTKLAGLNKKYFLYRIEKNQSRSFLLGTMHAGLPEDYFDPSINELFAGCETMLFEADREDFKQNQGDEIARMSYWPDGESLEQKLSAGAWAQMERLFNEPSLLQKIALLKPFAVAWELQGLAQQQLESETKVSWSFDRAIDGKLLSQAQQDTSKKIIFLDDPSLVLTRFERETTLQDLEAVLAKEHPIEELVHCAKEVLDAYKSGDLKAIEQYQQGDCETAGHRTLLEERNRQWEGPLNEAFTQGRACAAVGAGHLVGDNGLLNFLSQNGFKVEKATEVATSTSDPATPSNQVSSSNRVKQGVPPSQPSQPTQMTQSREPIQTEELTQPMN